MMSRQVRMDDAPVHQLHRRSRRSISGAATACSGNGAQTLLSRFRRGNTSVTLFNQIASVRRESQDPAPTKSYHSSYQFYNTPGLSQTDTVGRPFFEAGKSFGVIPELCLGVVP